MATKHKNIGGDGLEQGGQNLGNDYSRNISREHEEGQRTIIGPDKTKKPEKGTAKKISDKPKSGGRKS